jgi:hypothetical protein
MSGVLTAQHNLLVNGEHAALAALETLFPVPGRCKGATSASQVDVTARDLPVSR